jgi:ATP phosphoribosyltransferase regulatory subunit
MTIPGDKALLPAGLKDVLPPQAAQEAEVVERLMACFAAHGYDRVKPPLLEFETALLAGAGSDVAQQTFRLMDPVSQRMLGLRADMTPQIARIASTRLAKSPRPLRVCYAGQVLQVKGSQLRPERQSGQAGVELIGAPQERADAEVVGLAAEVLAEVGIADLSVDLNLPTLVGTLAAEMGLTQAKVAALRQALDRKDVSAVGSIAGAQSEPFTALLRAAGPVGPALQALRRQKMPKAVTVEVDRLARVIDLIRATMPDLTITLDPVEHRGFEYQTGISFILFSRKARNELGRGGRYAANGDDADSSTGFTLYMDSVIQALPERASARRIFVPAGSDPGRARDLRAEGWVTVAGLDVRANARAEARRLGCSHALLNNEIVAVTD